MLWFLVYQNNKPSLKVEIESDNVTFKSDRCDDITVFDVLKAADDFDHSLTGEYDFVGLFLAAESLHVGHCDIALDSSVQLLNSLV